MIQTSGVFLSVIIGCTLARDVPGYNPHLVSRGASVVGGGRGVGQRSGGGWLSSGGPLAAHAGPTGGHHQTEVVHPAPSWESSVYDSQGGLGRFAEQPTSFATYPTRENQGYSAGTGRQLQVSGQHSPDFQGSDQRFLYDRQMEHSREYPQSHYISGDHYSQEFSTSGDRRTVFPHASRQGGAFSDFSQQSLNDDQGYHAPPVAPFGNQYNDPEALPRGGPFNGYEVQQPNEHFDAGSHLALSSAASQRQGPSHSLVDNGARDHEARLGHGQEAGDSNRSGYRITLPSGSMEVAYSRGSYRHSHQSALQSTAGIRSPTSTPDPNRNPNAGIATVVNY